MISTYAKLAGAVVLLALFAWGAIADYSAGKKAGEDFIQAAWDKDKEAIEKLASDKAATDAKRMAELTSDNEGIVNDLQNQIDAQRRLNSDLASRLRLATSIPAGSGPLPKAPNNSSPATITVNDRLGQIDDAIAAAFTECAQTRSDYKALIAEIKPQI
jgi:hypothetical protein